MTHLIGHGGNTTTGTGPCESNMPKLYTQADLDAAVAEALTKERRRLRHGNAKLDTAKALDLLKTGMTQVQAAEMLGCSPLGLAKALKREGLPTTTLAAVRSAAAIRSRTTP